MSEQAPQQRQPTAHRRGSTVRLGRLAGIPIGIQPLWLVILGLLTYLLGHDYFPQEDKTLSDSAAYALGLISALLLFGGILLHELGHAVVARRNGMEVLGIDLWVFGGLAKLSRDSESPGEEFRIAAAGPFVTLILTVIGVVAVTIFSHANLGDNLAGDVVVEVVEADAAAVAGRGVVEGDLDRPLVRAGLAVETGVAPERRRIDGVDLEDTARRELLGELVTP